MFSSVYTIPGTQTSTHTLIISNQWHWVVNLWRI